MADIRGMRPNQALIRAHLDRAKPEAWDILQSKGIAWTDRLSEMVTGFREHDADPWRIVGLLADIGFLHLLESYEPSGFCVSPDDDESMSV